MMVAHTQSLHPRVAVSGLCFPDLTAVESIGAVGALGVTKTSMTSAKLLESGTAAVADACRRNGVEVVTTTALARFDLLLGADVSGQLQRAREDIARAEAVGATSVYTLTGPRAYPDWADNVDAYARVVAELADDAAASGVALMVEPTSWLYADLTFVHSFPRFHRVRGAYRPAGVPRHLPRLGRGRTPPGHQESR
jgi:sugar phosphate isomerase/epimerase